MILYWRSKVTVATRRSEALDFEGFGVDIVTTHIRVVGHYAQSYCSLGSDTRHNGEVIGGEGCCVLAPDWSTS